jgi:hypothetical protein
MLVLDMIEIIPPLGKYKYDTWRILPVKCYIDNFVRLRSCIRNVNTDATTSFASIPSPFSVPHGEPRATGVPFWRLRRRVPGCAAFSRRCLAPFSLGRRIWNGRPRLEADEVVCNRSIVDPCTSPISLVYDLMDMIHRVFFRKNKSSVIKIPTTFSFRSLPF